jgi:type IV pilus assembly protein PilB
MEKKRLGDILVELGFIDKDQLELALAESKKTGLMLGEVLLRLNWITEEQLQMAIAIQSGAKLLDTSKVNPDPEAIKLVPKDIAIKHEISPFAKEKDTLKIATANPFDVITKDKLARITGLKIEAYLAPRDWILKVNRIYYQTALSIDQEIEDITRLYEVSKTGLEENKIIRLSELLIEKGYLLGASDIHIVPDQNLVRVFYRIDGVLRPEYVFSKKLHQALVTRFKIMGDMDISNPNIPHDGRIRYKGSVGEFDIRVSTYPSHFGEIVVMRLLIYSSIVGELESLGFEKEDLEKFIKNIKRPYGLILTTGPTGSGKTTTLYSALMYINRPEINIMTVEDPIEFVIPSIRQSSVNPKADFTFANALRAAMRQDPDVILVGEIRDKETAELAMRASITGHLVLSTLHTNDAASAINRLLDIGINPITLSSSLVMVVAQRLVRRVCKNCVRLRAIKDEEAELFSKQGLIPPSEIPEPVGCDACRNSGYKGRTGIYEVMEITGEIENLIQTNPSRSAIERAAVNNNTDLLFKQALKKVARHLTSIEEILRVISSA